LHLEILADIQYNFHLLETIKYFYPYNTEAIFQLCPLIKDIRYFFITTSTLDHITELEQKKNILIIADGQLRGRGQYSRIWRSAIGRQIQMTYGPFFYNKKLAPSLYLAYVVMKTLLFFAPNLAIAFKWPNDLYLHGKKIAGLLVTASNQDVTISLGLNLTFDCLEFGSIWRSANFITREEFIAHFIKNLHTVTEDQYEILLFLEKSNMYKQKDKIVFTYQNAAQTGSFLQLNMDGSCLIYTDHDKQSKIVRMGSISRSI
jgi:biotin-(acetyl-CoA carboxylase) ligase